MTTFGWYYEGGTVQDEDDDIWVLIERAVPEAAEDDRMHALRVGEMLDCSVANYLEVDDIVRMSDEGRLTAENLADFMSEVHNEVVCGGYARLSGANAKTALDLIIQKHNSIQEAAPDILKWANEHIKLTPVRACRGDHPLPIEYGDGDGEWLFGGSEYDTEAYIDYTATPTNDTGHTGWVWWALGKDGDAQSLEEAKRAVEKELEGK